MKFVSIHSINTYTTIDTDPPALRCIVIALKLRNGDNERLFVKLDQSHLDCLQRTLNPAERTEDGVRTEVVSINPRREVR